MNIEELINIFSREYPGRQKRWATRDLGRKAFYVEQSLASMDCYQKKVFVWELIINYLQNFNH